MEAWASRSLDRKLIPGTKMRLLGLQLGYAGVLLVKSHHMRAFPLGEYNP